MADNHLTTNERVSLRMAGLSFCPRCDKVVELLSFAEAARFHNTDREDLERLAESGKLHRLHDRRARLKICGLSLFDVINHRRTRLLDETLERAVAAQRDGK